MANQQRLLRLNNSHEPSFYDSIEQLFNAYSRKIPISSFRLLPVLPDTSPICATVSSFTRIEKVL